MGNVPSVAPYGTWKSPISAALAVQRTVLFQQPDVCNGDIYWIEERAAENGRSVIMHETADGAVKELPAPWSARSTLYGRGGGAFAVHDATLFFVEETDQRVYRLDPGCDPVPLTRSDARFGGLTVDPSRPRLLAIRESGVPPERALVALDFNARDSLGTPLLETPQFLSAPSMSPDGQKVAWTSWPKDGHPDRGAALYYADLHDETPLRPTLVVDYAEKAIAQPLWSPDGHLFFLSDQSGWWNLYEWDFEAIRPVTSLHADFGEFSFRVGLHHFGFLDRNRLIASYWIHGQAFLVSIDRSTREMTHLPCPYTQISSLWVHDGQVLAITASDRLPDTVTRLNVDLKRHRTVRRAPVLPLEEEALSIGEPLTFPLDNGELGYAFYYPAKSPDYIAPEGEYPPLILRRHSDKVGRATARFSPEVHYWTTRGFSVVDLNFGGSCGYGRAYRTMPIDPVHEIDALIRFLSRHQKADADRVILHDEGPTPEFLGNPRNLRAATVRLFGPLPVTSQLAIPTLAVQGLRIHFMGPHRHSDWPTVLDLSSAHELLQVQLRCYAAILGIRLPYQTTPHGQEGIPTMFPEYRD